jgi:1,4-dihydroxy-2-naphthoyl-CoA hydrolase
MKFHPERNETFFNQLSKGYLPDLLGIQIDKITEEHFEASFELRKELFAPNGFVHAGSLVTLADTLAGFACVAYLPDGAKGFTTIELKSNFLSTAKEGKVIAIAKPEHLGKQTQVWDVVVKHAETERKMAIFRCTQMILYP